MAFESLCSSTPAAVDRLHASHGFSCQENTSKLTCTSQDPITFKILEHFAPSPKKNQKNKKTTFDQSRKFLSYFAIPYSQIEFSQLSCCFRCWHVQNKKGNHTVTSERNSISLIKNAVNVLTCANRNCIVGSHIYSKIMDACVRMGLLKNLTTSTPKK